MFPCLSQHFSRPCSRLTLRLSQRGGVRAGLACLLLLLSLGAYRAQAQATPPKTTQSVEMLDATIYLPANADGPQQAAVQMLRDQMAQRTGQYWHLATYSSTTPLPQGLVIAVGRTDQLDHSLMPQPSTPWPQADERAEGFRINTFSSAGRTLVRISGQDDRGMLYGIGYLLRHMEFAPATAVLPEPIDLASAPEFAVRGFQLGYRYKNNTYDAWTPERFEQYIEDLAVFGTNTIEILPPHTDDRATSPLFPVPAMQMMIDISAITKKYGLRCSVYYPAMAKNYADPATQASELKAWGQVLSKLPEVDALFVPGGDPGHTAPSVLFPFLAKMSVVLHKYHPKATIWVSAQGFNAQEMKNFYALINAHPAWLTGVVAGPQSRDSILVQRAHISPSIPIRFYPDIAHTMQAQFPVQKWDPVYALTEGREVIEPRPLDETAIFRDYAPAMYGFVGYSEGVNDDVNKFLWAALGWNQKADPSNTLLEYARYFLGSDGFSEQTFAEGLLDLERNWQGPIASNTGVDRTFKLFETMQAEATPTQLDNWRFQEALYRAYTDEYERQRYLADQSIEQRAMAALATAPKIGSLAAMQQAAAVLNTGTVQHLLASTPSLRAWHSTIEMLGGELFDNIGIQLSVEKYGAAGIMRGASLDTLDVALNNRVWLLNQFAHIRTLTSESARLAAIEAVVDWKQPGAGSFYDNLGDASDEPNLVRGPGYPTDPAFLHTALDAVSNFTPNDGWRMSQISNAGALYDNDLELRFTGLDPKAHYRLRIDYAGEGYTLPMTLVANGTYTLQKSFHRKHDPEFIELDLPQAAVKNGVLDLRWTRPQGMGGGGRGLQVAEVWLLRQPAKAK